MSAEGLRDEKTKAALKLLGNPYASLSLVEDREDVDLTNVITDPKRVYYKLLENPCAYDSIFGDPVAEGEEKHGTSDANTCDVTSHQKSRCSKKSFQDGCRRIFLQYIPPSEGRTLRPHYRDFIIRNETNSPEHRFRLLGELRKYDISTSGDFKPHFNREQEFLTKKKLQQIEEAAQSQAPSHSE